MSAAGTAQRAARALLAALLLCAAQGHARAGEAAQDGRAAAGAAKDGRAQDRAALMRQHRGGTLRLLAQSAAGSLDPQVNDTAQFWQIFALAYDGLVAFRKLPGAAGRTVVADLAEDVPAPRDGGRLYVFRLRRDVRFSDGREVGAEDVAASFRRLFRVLGPTAAPLYGAMIGAEACLAAPSSCTLRDGVVADPRAGTVTIRLARPDPEFLLKLALPPASILPADAPARDAGTAPLPGTGPYRIVSYDPNAAMRIERNPFFREWSAEAQPDGFPDAIDYAFGLEDEAEVTEIENDQADWMFDTPPADRLGELGARFAALVHLDPAFAVWFLPMNVHLPPFDDVRVRQAVNLAIDRRAAVKLFGGPRLAVPSCQFLPPGLPGYEPYCPYTRDPGARWTSPDMDRARRLVAASGTAGQVVTLVTDDSTVQRAIGTYLQSVLRELGYDARVRALSGNLQFTFIQNSDNHVQISLTSWYADYPSPADFLLPNFGCASFHPGSDASVNISGFCDPGLDARMQAALAAEATDPGQAARLWAEADRSVTDQAPAAVLFAPGYIDVTSSRVGHFIYHEQFHWLLSQSWVR